MDVSIIIVNYNTTRLTTFCLESIYQHTKENSFEIILIDNGSEDRSISAISNVYPQVKLILNQQNVGFGSANNQGIAISQGKYIFLLNSDTLLTSDAINVFFNYMEMSKNANIAVCGGALLGADGRELVGAGNFPTFFEAFSALGFFKLYPGYYKRHISSGIYAHFESTTEVDYICGADMFLRKSVLDIVGSFDSDFFLYFEETELSYRIVRAGYRSVIIPDVKIVHFEGSSHASNDTFNIQKLTYFAQGRKLFYEKCYGQFGANLVNKIYGIQSIIFFIVRGDRRHLKSATILLKS